MGDHLATKIQMDVPFVFQRGDGETIQLTFPSFEGDIRVNATEATIHSWMDIQRDEHVYVGGSSLWMIQKRNAETLIFCLVSLKKTIFPCDVQIEDLSVVLHIDHTATVGGHDDIRVKNKKKLR